MPEGPGFATKPAIALAMIDRVYGVGDIEMALRRAGKGYVLGVHIG